MTRLSQTQKSDNKADPALFDIICPSRAMGDVVLAPQAEGKIKQIIHEFFNFNLLEDNGA
jgi:hypothetical protein